MTNSMRSITTMTNGYTCYVPDMSVIPDANPIKSLLCLKALNRSP